MCANDVMAWSPPAWSKLPSRRGRALRKLADAFDFTGPAALRSAWAPAAAARSSAAATWAEDSGVVFGVRCADDCLGADGELVRLSSPSDGDRSRLWRSRLLSALASGEGSFLR
jgi:hypothetical protein